MTNVTKNHQKKIIFNSLRTFFKHLLSKIANIHLRKNGLFDDSISFLFKFHKEGSKIGVILVSNAMSYVRRKGILLLGFKYIVWLLLMGFYQIYVCW